MNDTTDAISNLTKAQASLDAATTSAAWVQPWSQELVRFLATSVLAFSSLALMISAALLWRAAATEPQILRVTGVISIVAFSALLLVVGYDNQQLTPIVGLFGAIAGYLLGKDSGTTQSQA
jgi:hypothetical protein